MQFWEKAASTLVKGNRDRDKNARLNALLPRPRSGAVSQARRQAGEEIKAFTKLAMAGSFTAVAALAGFAELFGPEGRSALRAAAGYLALAGVSATTSLLLSIVEPTFRAAVPGRLEEPEGPVTDQEDFYFSEAVNDRLYQASTIVRAVLLWRMVAGMKAITLILCAGAFCAALIVAVGALE